MTISRERPAATGADAETEGGEFADGRDGSAAVRDSSGGRRGDRRRVRRVRHHLALAALTAISLAGFYVLAPVKGTIHLWSMATAYTGLWLLVTALALGPLNVLRSRPNPVSFDLRRDIGIWAGLLGLAHVVVGLQVHMKGRMWAYFVYPPEQPHSFPLQHGIFGLANWTGLAAGLGLLLLLGLSNDLSLRRLRSRRWKSLQRWAYWIFGLVVVHGVAYQLIEKRALWFVYLFGAVVAAACVAQAAGFGARRASRREGEGRS